MNELTLDDIYNETYDDILKYVVIHAKSLDDVNDLIQNIYFSLFKKIKAKHNIENINAYLFGIAKNEINKYYRFKYKINLVSIFYKKENIELIDTLKSDIDIEASFLKMSDIDYVWKYLLKKKEIIQKVFFLYYYLGLSIKEIAEELNITESNVKHYIYRTLSELKEALNEYNKSFNKYINKDENLKIIKERMNKKDMKYLKYSLIPICLILIISLFLIIYNNKPDIFDDTKEIYINELDNMNLTSLDSNIRVENNYMVETYDELLNIVIPDDLNKMNGSAIFLSDGTLNNYIVEYFNGDRRITIAYSESNTPIRDYFIDDGKSSIIKNTNLVISKYNTIYIVTFKYNDIYFDIETSNIEENELIDLLESIIK